MPIIHFYDTSDADQPTFRQQFKGDHTLRFTAGPLTAATADPEAEIVSVFISSHADAAAIAAMPHLTHIACRSTGFNHVDLAAAAARHITVSNVPTYGEHTVAEYTFGLLLALTRRLIPAAAAVRAGDPSREALQGHDLYGRTFGLVGTGRIGRRVATIAQGFGLQVIAHDLYPDATWAEQASITYHELPELLATADIISLHLPYSPEAHHLIGAEQLKAMKPTAILVNTARGELVDTAALATALQDHTIAGAALDVFEGEATLGHPATSPEAKHLHQLTQLPNTVITNHNAFNTTEAISRINTTSAANIEAHLAGHPQNLVAAS